MNYEFFEITEYSGYCCLTINRPAKKNALNSQMRQDLLHFLSVCEGRYHAVVLTGAGNAFCSGADLSEGNGPSLKSGEEFWELTNGLYESNTIFIAAVNGSARGGGLSLVNACDLAFASPDATFGVPEVNYGVYAGISGPTTQLAAPKKLVSKMLLTGDAISAEDAERAYLINEVVSADQLMKIACSYAEKLVSLDSQTLGSIKTGMNNIPFGRKLRDEAKTLSLGLNLEMANSRNN